MNISSFSISASGERGNNKKGVKKKISRGRKVSLETNVEPGEDSETGRGPELCVPRSLWSHAEPGQGARGTGRPGPRPWPHGGQPTDAPGPARAAPALPPSSGRHGAGVQLCVCTRLPEEASRHGARLSSCLFWAFKNSCQLATD